MSRNWTFGQKIGAGFAVTVGLAIAVGVISVCALQNVVASKDGVITVSGENILDTARLAAAGARATAASRGFMLDHADKSLVSMNQYREEYQVIIARLRPRLASDEERALLNRIEKADSDYRAAADALIEQSKAGGSPATITLAFETEILPRKQIEVVAMDAFMAHQQVTREAAKLDSTKTASEAITLVVSLSIALVLFAGIVAFALIRGLGHQIGTAVSQVQSSSAELQVAARQQTAGAEEQATAMNEITITIRELLASSRQIAESALRVSSVAAQTVGAARSGDGTVIKASEAIAGIRRQVDLVVSHMLELGKKSQQIGSVLEIVSELAEQTNILAINATIEAAGAGETGRRFAVVAEEIRKLADRVSGSTKEIRNLIEDVRGAVNTTIMATETGSKTVDAGNQKFSEVADSFKQIASLVSTTTEAAHEIELSTKQQSTAVEQVNVAIANVVQAAKEAEVSSMQTLQTASQLADLSKDLLRMVRPQTSV